MKRHLVLKRIILIINSSIYSTILCLFLSLRAYMLGAYAHCWCPNCIGNISASDYSQWTTVIVHLYAIMALFERLSHCSNDSDRLADPLWLYCLYLVSRCAALLYESMAGTNNVYKCRERLFVSFLFLRAYLISQLYQSQVNRRTKKIEVEDGIWQKKNEKKRSQGKLVHYNTSSIHLCCILN